jgi:hypothetical protein
MISIHTTLIASIGVCDIGAEDNMIEELVWIMLIVVWPFKLFYCGL